MRRPFLTAAPPDLLEPTGTTGSMKAAASTSRSASPSPPPRPATGECSRNSSSSSRSTRAGRSPEAATPAYLLVDLGHHLGQVPAIGGRVVALARRLRAGRRFDFRPPGLTPAPPAGPTATHRPLHEARHRSDGDRHHAGRPSGVHHLEVAGRLPPVVEDAAGATDPHVDVVGAVEQGNGVEGGSPRPRVRPAACEGQPQDLGVGAEQHGAVVQSDLDDEDHVLGGHRRVELDPDDQGLPGQQVPALVRLGVVGRDLGQADRPRLVGGRPARAGRTGSARRQHGRHRRSAAGRSGALRAPMASSSPASMSRSRKSRTASPGAPWPIITPSDSTTARSQMARTWSGEWETNRMVRPSLLEPLHPVHALALEALVAHGQHLVDRPARRGRR